MLIGCHGLFKMGWIIFGEPYTVYLSPAAKVVIIGFGKGSVQGLVLEKAFGSLYYIIIGYRCIYQVLRALLQGMLLGNNKRRIEKIQTGDSTIAPNFQNKQHLVITRDQQKYKVNLSNKKQREERSIALKQDFRQLIQTYQIDTVYTLNN